MIHDVAVLGATVAGLTAARVLAREGFDVVVLDPNPEHRSASFGHGVAAQGPAATFADMAAAYGEPIAVEHMGRNQRGIDFLREVLAEAGQPPAEPRFVDGSLPGPTQRRAVAALLREAGVQVAEVGDTLVSDALVLNPSAYAEALRAQCVAAGAQVVHGVTVTHVRRKEGATGIAFRNNLAWAREPGAVAAVACIDTLGVTPWGRMARVAAAQWLPTAMVRLPRKVEDVELHATGPMWMVRPDGDRQFVVGQRTTLGLAEAAREAFVAELEGIGAEVLDVGSLTIDPSDHGRPVVGASAIPGGYYARGNGRGELMNGTASGLWLGETLVGLRDGGQRLPRGRRMRAGVRSWVLAHRR